MYEKPSAQKTLQRDSMKLRSWKTLLFEVFFFLLISLWLDFVFVIATLEIFLPNHTWKIIISSKPYFVIIKTEINQPWFHICDSYAIHYRTWMLLYLELRILGFWMQLLFHFMVSWFYAYEMQVYMNVVMLNISKSCFNVYSLFFFIFGGFDVFDVLSFCEHLIYKYY